MDKKKFFKSNLALIVFLAALLITIIVFLIIDINKGWNGQKTLTYSFSVVILVSGVGTSVPLVSFFVSNNSLMMRSNNDLFRMFELAENKKALLKYKTLKDNQSKDKYLIRMNSILEDNGNSIILTHETVDDFMKKKKYLKKPFSLSDDERATLHLEYINYSNEFSKTFEKQFSDYKTKNMIARKEFPLLSTVLPLILSLVGIFGSIYQEINSTEHIRDSLIMYIIIVVEIIVLGVFFAWKTARDTIPSLVKSNDNTIKEIESFLKKK